MNRHFAQLGLEAIDRFPPSKRDISSVVLGVPKSKLPLLKKEIRNFHRHMIELAECDDNETTDSFYTLVHELYPIACAHDPKRGL